MLRASKQREMANFNKRLLSCLYLPLIDFICRIRIRYPFRAESPRKGHYRESPGIGTHKHTRHSYLNSSISQCKNKKNKKKNCSYSIPRSTTVIIDRHLEASGCALRNECFIVAEVAKCLR